MAPFIWGASILIAGLYVFAQGFWGSVQTGRARYALLTVIGWVIAFAGTGIIALGIAELAP